MICRRPQTLILDCCCSAGLNRSAASPNLIPRQILNAPPLSSKTDRDIPIPPPPPKPAAGSASITRSLKASSGFGGKFHDSHVLLAACAKDRVAFEHNGHGLFTSALMSVLPSIDETTTYSTLMKRLKSMPPWCVMKDVSPGPSTHLLLRQVPHCEGNGIDRPIFNLRGERSDPSFIAGERHKRPGETQITVTIEAGHAQGITLGEVFSIHETNRSGSPSIGTLVATNVQTSSTTLGQRPGLRPFKIPRNFYAKQIEWTNEPPKVYCEDRIWLERVFPSDKRKIVAVERPEEADLIIALDGETATISRTDPLINEYVPSPLPHIFDKDAYDDVRTIVGAWQHFNYHLNRKGKNQFKNVRIEMHYLDSIEMQNMYEAEVFKPVGDNLLAEEPAKLYISNEDDDKPLGVTIYNDGDTPLYPYLFYFDPNTLCIRASLSLSHASLLLTPTLGEWYSGPQGAGQGNVNPPLEAHSLLPVGHGNGAQTPWQFCFDSDDRDKDIGFLKLFLTTSPANFSSIKREDSPFEKLGKGRTRGYSPVPRALELEEEEELDADSWGVKVATLIQLRVGEDTDLEKN